VFFETRLTALLGNDDFLYAMTEPTSS